MSLLIYNNNRPKGTRLKTISGDYLTMDENNCIVLIDSPGNFNIRLGDYIPPGFTCYLLPLGGAVTFLADAGISYIGPRMIDSPGAMIEVSVYAPQKFHIKTGGTGGTSPESLSIYKLVGLTFDGTPGKGAIGPYTLPASDPDLPEQTIINELYFDVTGLLVADPEAFITFGIETDGFDCALNDETGLVSTLNDNLITKILTPDFVKTTAPRNFIMQIGGAAITGGSANILIQTLKF